MLRVREDWKMATRLSLHIPLTIFRHHILFIDITNSSYAGRNRSVLLDLLFCEFESSKLNPANVDIGLLILFIILFIL